MSFFLDFTPEKGNFELTHQNTIFLLGSCFNTNLEQHFIQHGFVTTNPYHTVFNPISIAKHLHYTLEETLALSIEEHQGYFFNFDFHSSFSSNSAQESLAAIAKVVEEGKTALANTPVLIITFGTAWVYENNSTIVANCHKLPQELFNKRLLTVEEIITIYNQLFLELKEEISQLKIIFTISPVRHIKDGLVENNLSKAVLRLAINQLVQENSFCEYFPAYEIVTDQLRDYRFYNRDLIHPNNVAVEFVWEKFLQSYCTELTQEYASEVKKVAVALSHRSKNPFSMQEKERLTQLLIRVESIANQIGINLDIVNLIREKLLEIEKE